MKKIFTLLLLLSSLVGFSQSTTIVISQVYGAGGNTGATFKADYVELHNVSAVSQSTSGLSIQYGSATVSGPWSGLYALPAATIPAGGYYLIQMSTAGTIGADLPTPDATVPSPGISMAAGSGRVALVNGTTALSACPAASAYIDFVGYGTSSCFEGTTGAAPTISTILAAFRKNNGCLETNNNATDFEALTPAPRNSATAANICGVTPASLTVTGTIADFGNVFTGSTSASQSYNISGANLTGAPGNITVTAPSADFQVSNNNSSWGASTTIAYASATLASTPVWVRFSPQSAGLKTGNVSNAGGGVATAVTVAVSGTGVVPVDPALSATTLNAFGNVCVNTTAGPNSFTINGTNLTTANISVGPLAGFTFSTTSGGTYTPSLSLTQAGGVFSQQVFVQFTPTAVQSYNGNIVVSGGGAASSINVAASGAGNNNAPTVVTGGATAITINSATLSGTISSIGCTAVTAYGIEYSTTNGFANGSGTQVTSTNLSGAAFSAAVAGLAPNTVYYYKAYATNIGGTAYGVQQSFTTTAAVLTATPLTAFGNLCLNTTAGPNSFTISSTGLGTANVTVAALTGYTYATTANGTYTTTLSITQPGGPFTQTIFVKLTAATAQSYNGNIAVGGGGATTINVAASGTGANAPASITTTAAANIGTATATLGGTITSYGCSNVTEYGIEYSGINNFTTGSGTKVAGGTIDAQGNFAANVNGLVQGTVYYFRAWSKNTGGTSYGAQQSFTTASIPNGLVLYGNPAIRNTALRFSVNNIKPDHYAVVLFNSNGQKVYRKDMIVQTNFINDAIIVPGKLAPGVYQFQLENVNGYRERKTIMIK